MLDQIIQMDESVRAINTDIQAFKNIRTQLLQRESNTKTKAENDKFFIYFFHIFESVVNNTSNLVSKYSSHLIS